MMVLTHDMYELAIMLNLSGTNLFTTKVAKRTERSDHERLNHGWFQLMNATKNIVHSGL